MMIRSEQRRWKRCFISYIVKSPFLTFCEEREGENYFKPFEYVAMRKYFISIPRNLKISSKPFYSSLKYGLLLAEAIVLPFVFQRRDMEPQNSLPPVSKLWQQCL